ncbi:MAG: arginine--tRNA ligase, partial [Bacteroidia bacterium]
MELKLKGYVADAIATLYEVRLSEDMVQIQETRKEFSGDFTLVVFPLLKYSGKSPESTASQIGDFLVNNFQGISGYNVIKGFLNISLESRLWLDRFRIISSDAGFGFQLPTEKSPTVLVEYSSPNTNKPLHLGHIRNNLLGFSISRILEANGIRVVMTNIVNDRGIHICKSMLAWRMFGEGETPFDPPQKGDQLVGKYYVRFDTEYKKEIAELIASGLTEQEAASGSTLMEAARDMLRKWEAGDNQTIALWEMMNNWVYNGFNITYKNLGV